MDAGKESILNPYVFKESILNPYVFQNPILYSNIILGGSCWLHFFFAAGNFSCLHLIARSLKVQGVSWSAVHVVKIGNWLEDTSHASKVGLPSVKVAQLSRLCACGISKLSSRTSTGLFCSSVHLSPIYSYLSRHLQLNSDRIPLSAPCGPEPAGFSTCRIWKSTIDGMTTEGTSNRHRKSDVLFIL